MGNEVVTREAGPNITAGGKVAAIVPQSFDEMWRLSGALLSAGITPEGIDTREKLMIALMAGAEAGLSPMASVQGIMIVNKRPSIWGDAALALVLASDLVEDHEEIGAGEGDAHVATCTIHRKGRKKPTVRTFSIADAKAAALMGKDPWKKYPKRMCQMRARAWALRDTFADVLKGLHIVEEVRDIEPTSKDKLLAGPPAAPVEEEIEKPEEEEKPAADEPTGQTEEIVDAEATAVEEGSIPERRVETTDDARDALGNEPPAASDGPPSIEEDDEVDESEPFDIGDFVDKTVQRMQELPLSASLDDFWLEEVDPFTGALTPPDVEFLERKRREEEAKRQ